MDSPSRGKNRDFMQDRRGREVRRRRRGGRLWRMDGVRGERKPGQRGRGGGCEGRQTQQWRGREKRGAEAADG